MARTHFFDIKVAELYGVNCAVILENIYYWIEHNKANGTNFHDGRFWTFNSTKAFKELFPYLSKKQIETALNKLRDAGILVTGNYNQLKYDRTLWYAITEKGYSILLRGEMEMTAVENGNDTEVTPIPNINTNTKPPKNTDIFIPPTLEEIEDYCRLRGNKVDAKKFYDYFTAGNWTDAKGNKVKNWKQKLITWEAYSNETTRGNTSNNGPKRDGSEYAMYD